MKVWIGKAARFYNCDYTTLENLYYRPNRSIPNEIYIKLTSLRTPRLNPETNSPHLNELITKLELQQKEIMGLRDDITRERDTRRKLAEWLSA